MAPACVCCCAPAVCRARPVATLWFWPAICPMSSSCLPRSSTAPATASARLYSSSSSRFGPGGLLLLDRDDPCRWLVAALKGKGIGFCMRVDTPRAASRWFGRFVPLALPGRSWRSLRPMRSRSPTSSAPPGRRACAWFAMSTPTAACAS